MGEIVENSEKLKKTEFKKNFELLNDLKIVKTEKYEIAENVEQIRTKKIRKSKL